MGAGAEERGRQAGGENLPLAGGDVVGEGEVLQGAAVGIVDGEARQRHEAFYGRWANLAERQEIGITGAHIVEALRPVLADDALFLVDGGNIGQWAHMLLCRDRYPGHWLTCGVSGVVGWGMGGAMAARLAYPDRPVILLSGDGALGYGLPEFESAARQRLPFVVIVADDMGYADIGVHGCKDIPTPHIDALARAGVRCTNGYVSGPYCSPTRAGLLTGRYQTRFGHEFNAGGRGENNGLPVTETGVAEVSSTR